MIAFVRLAVVGFIVLTVFYFLLSIYLRSLRRENLENEWDEEIREGDRDAFIENGMRAYDHSLRRRLVLLVYVIPIIVIGVLMYAIN